MIHQHCRASRSSQQGNGSLEPLFAIKGFHSLSAIAIDEFIQMWIPQSLIDGSKTRLGTLEGGLSVKLPAAHVADGEDHTSASQNIPFDDFAVHKGRDAEDRFPRKNGRFE